MSRRVRHDWLLSRFKTSHRQATRRATKISIPFRRQLRIEPLEDRRLLALVTVNTLNDTVDFSDGVTSLREAIFATNLVGDADTIEFAASLTSAGAATITLTQGELAITDALAINGPGANLLTIDASGNDPTPDSTFSDGNTTNDGDGSRVFKIDDLNSGNLLNVSIGGLTLTGGDSNGDGGAINNRENLTVTDSTISGNSASGSSTSDGGGIYNSGSLTVTASTINGNSATGDGGAIRTTGSNSLLLVTDSTLSGNSAKVDGGAISSSYSSVTVTRGTLSGNLANGSGVSDGGAVWVRGGSLVVTDSTISNNSAIGGGGGISKSSGSLTVTGSTLSGNMALGTSTFGASGGGIRSSGGNLTIADSTISGNSASRDGGGIYMSVSGILTVTNSTVEDNTAARDGAGIWKGPSGALVVTGSTLSGNIANDDGGGIYCRANLTVTGSTISGNSAGSSAGGVYARSSTLNISDSTISGNTATANGGGVYISGSGTTPSTIRRSTITANTATAAGGGVFIASGNLVVENSIVAANTANAGRDITGLLGAVLDVRFSLIGSNAGSGLVEAPIGAPDANGNIIGGAAPINPLLGPLADNGGPTLTHAVLSGSSAIDAGDPTAVAGVGGVPEFDQRGAPYVRVFGPGIDIGAFERQSLPGLSFVVDTLADENDGDYSPGDLSLREAIELANHRMFSADTIMFASALTAGGPATILLTQGELKLTDLTSIIGPGATLLTVDGSGNDPTPDVNNGDGSRLFNLDNGNAEQIAIEIGGLTLAGGDVNGDGGAILSRENLSVRESTITGNSATRGGGIYGTMTVSGSTVSGNTASGVGGGLAGDTQSVVTGSTVSGNMGTGIDGVGTVTDSLITSNSGSGISSNRRVIVTGSTISGNAGAGIRVVNFGGLAVTDSIISDNLGGGISASRTRGFIGGVPFFTSLLTVTRSTISGNSTQGVGGGIRTYAHYRYAMSTSVFDSTISGNSAGGDGGGIRNYSGTLFVSGSTISGNSAGRDGGGIRSYRGSVSVLGSTISGNSAARDGGGMFSVVAPITHTVRVSNSTISGNSAGAAGGGIVSNYLHLYSSTISGNSATNGGGISISSGGYGITRTNVTHSTIVGNTASVDGGGIHGGIITIGTRVNVLIHTILAGNTRGSGQANDVTGRVLLLFSLLGVDTGATIIDETGAPSTDEGGNLIGTAAAPIDPLLGPLADNGGPTLPDGSKILTHALLAGSPAIDAGDPESVAGVGDVPAFDQRGNPFLRVFDGDGAGGGPIDMGAFELIPVDAVHALFGDYNRNGSTDAGDYVLWRKTLGSSVAPYSSADGSGNGVVDQADRKMWMAHFGQTVPALAATGTVAGVFDPGPGLTEAGYNSVVAVRAYQSQAEGSVAELSTVVGAQTKPPAEPGAVGPTARVTVTLVDRASRIEGRGPAHWRDEALVAWLATREVYERRDDQGSLARSIDRTSAVTSPYMVDAVFEGVSLDV